jgi:urease accessory protein
MTRIATALALSAAAIAAAAAPAEAHTFGAAGAGLAGGFAHPLLGLDHLLAMVGVGAWAAQLGGRSRWGVPAAFVAMMALGGLLGASGLEAPLVEFGIAGSVLIVGCLVACNARLGTASAMAVVAVFALFHGHAHGAEMPAAANAALYGLGFAAATALLHAAGFAAAELARRPMLVRLGGGAVAAAGLLLLAGG